MIRVYTSSFGWLVADAAGPFIAPDVTGVSRE